VDRARAFRWPELADIMIESLEEISDGLAPTSTAAEKAMIL